MNEIAHEVKANPGQTTVDLLYAVTPFADAAKIAWDGIGSTLKGEANLSTVLMAATVSASTEAMLGGVIGKAVKRGGRFIAAVEMRVTEKVYESQFKSMSGKIAETLINWTSAYRYRANL